jgi:hypothetical protein
MKRLAFSSLLAVALFFFGYAVRPALSDDPKPPTPNSLRDAWKSVQGHYGNLKDDPRGQAFAVSLRDKVGTVLVESVGSDCVVLGSDAGAPGWHTIIPLDKVELQIYQ